MLRRTLPVLACGLALLAAAPSEARAATVVVGSDAEFSSAVAKLRTSGGTIVLRRGRYRKLVVGPRGGRRLAIRARHGASAGTLRLRWTRNVQVTGLRITSRGGRARLDILRSRNIVLEKLVVRGKPRVPATIRLDHSTGVTIRRSELTECGEIKACVLTGRSNGIRLVRNRFHDCHGCDFVRGYFGRSMLVRENRFDRAVRGPCGRNPNRCNHQDLIELQGGRGLVVERNHFGLYQLPGGGQLYLLLDVRDVVVRNNVFLATDRRVPGVESHVAVNLGGQKTAPRNVVVTHNTILSGKPRPAKGVNGSVRLVKTYAGVPFAERPVIANNVIRLAPDPGQLCDWAQVSRGNVVLDGLACTPADAVGNPHLGGRGRPTADSALTIDRADPAWAIRFDADGRRRDALPDIGAYEYAGP